MQASGAAIPFAVGCAGAVVLLALPILVLTFRSAIGGRQSESEPNESVESASVYRWPGPMAALLDEPASGRQRDVFYIPPAPDGSPIAELSIEREPAAPGVVIEVLDADGRVAVRFEPDPASTLVHPNLALGSTGAFVTVSPAADSQLRCVLPGRCDYRLVARARPAWIGEEVEPNGDVRTANEIRAAEAATASLGWPGDIDVWHLEPLGADERVALRVEGSAGIDVRIELLDGDGAILRTVDTSGSGGDELTRYDRDTFTELPEFVRVSGAGRPERTYRVEVEVSSTAPAVDQPARARIPRTHLNRASRSEAGSGEGSGD